MVLIVAKIIILQHLVYEVKVGEVLNAMPVPIICALVFIIDKGGPLLSE